MIEKSMGKRIQQYRKQKGITQEKLGEMLGLSTNHISALECGKYGIKPELLVNIINILGCTADDIFCDVIDTGYKIRASRIADELDNLPVESRERVLDVLETLIKTYQ